MASFPAMGNLASPALVLMVLSLYSVGVNAQAVFRSVGPDGRVTFSDRPGPQAQTPRAGTTGGGVDPSAAPALPYALAQVVTRYPVTLYTAKECGPCDTGRQLLIQRGVPFAEKTVNSNDDIAAFGRLNPDNSLPLLTLGGQLVKGFSERDWVQYLDAAGYPAQSALPSGYKNASATPLAPPKLLPERADAAAAGLGTDASGTARKTPVKPVPIQPNQGQSNPAGIRF